MDRDFTAWLSKFKKSIANYDYYVDFRKIHDNVDKIKVELNILNSLIGSKNIEVDFDNIIEKYPETLKCIPILLAVRSNEIYAIDGEGEFIYQFKKLNYSVEQYKTFMRKTGLFDLIKNHLVNNLVDYVTGVETGLDSNGRKNRGGHLMEDLVESYIKKSGNIEYYKEIYIHEIQNKWGIDLSAISNKGKAEKRFDFVVKTDNMIYAIETNFYGGGGSKLNETARAYSDVAPKINQYPNDEIVWITDGQGWITAKNKLEEAYNIIPSLYNLITLEDFIKKIQEEKVLNF